MKKLPRYIEYIQAAINSQASLGEQVVGKIIETVTDNSGGILLEIQGEKKQLGQTNYEYMEVSAPILLTLGELSKHGLSEKLIDKIAYEYWTLVYKPMNRTLRWFLARLFNSRILMRGIFRKIANNSIKYKDHKYSWVADYVEPDEENQFLYGLNFTNCGISTLSRERNLEQFLPYMCAGDFADMRSKGLNFTRTKTRARGCEFCDFRYHKAGVKETQKGCPNDLLPENLNPLNSLRSEF